jgi:hypothetical protein
MATLQLLLLLLVDCLLFTRPWINHNELNQSYPIRWYKEAAPKRWMLYVVPIWMLDAAPVRRAASDFDVFGEGH